MYFNIKNLNFKYSDNEVIFNNFNLSLEKGEILVITGKSGIGKTTLLRIIAGFEKANGEILINNTNISNISPNKRNIGFVFQDYALFPHLNVFKNISFGIKHKKDIKPKVDFLLNLIKMKDYMNKYPHELSGGQQQRVAIARALAVEPNILLMDEPFSNLDEELKNNLIFEIKTILKTLNITTIIVTHGKEELKIADKIIEIK